VMRPHSRAESQPDPLPTPWKPNFAPQSQLVSHQYSPTSPNPYFVGHPLSPATTEEAAKVHPAFKEPLLSPSQPPPKSASKKKLSPLRPKSVGVGTSFGSPNLSKSIDGLNIKPSIIEQPGGHTVSGVAWQPHRKIVPLKTKRNSEGALHGWSSVQRLGGQPPADIQSLMSAGQSMPSTSLNPIPYDKHKLDVTTSNSGSVTSVDHEMFTLSNNPSPQESKGPSPQASNSHFRQPGSTEGLMIGREVPRHQHPLPSHQTHNRSSSAMPTKRWDMGQHAPEHSNSMEHVGVERQRQLNQYHHYHHQELPSLEDGKVWRTHQMGLHFA
jgi:hypothetical protein